MIASLSAAPLQENNTATIVNSGSTNRPGFRIVIDRSGAAEFKATPRRRAVQLEAITPMKMAIPRALADRLYVDLKTAGPLAALPASRCMKSVSFGSTLKIEFGGEQTPDLSCGPAGNPALANLTRDCDEIVALFQRK